MEKDYRVSQDKKEELTIKSARVETSQLNQWPPHREQEFHLFLKARWAD